MRKLTGLFFAFGLLTACGGPVTTVRVAPAPIAVTPDAATLVVVYPAEHGDLDWRGDVATFGPDHPFRVYTGDGKVLADVKPNTYSIVQLGAGQHTLIATDFGSYPPSDVSVVDANVERGRLYVVRMDFATSAPRGFRLRAIPASELTAALQQLPRLDRVALDPTRAPHPVLDSSSRFALLEAHVARVRRTQAD